MSTDLILTRVKFKYADGESTGTITHGTRGAKKFKVMTDAGLNSSPKVIIDVFARDVIALGGHDHSYGGGERAPDTWERFVQAV